MKKVLLCLLIVVLSNAATFAQNAETIEVPSAIFKGSRKVTISLPDGYANFPSRKYPVVLFFDAQSADFFNYAKATLNYLQNSADIFIGPVILVGIQTNDRRFEFLPKNKTDQPLKDFGSQVHLGGADSLALHLKDELMPYIEQHYRCQPYRVSIGHSLGGSFVTYALLKYPGLFNAAIAISPNFYYDNEQLLTLFDPLLSSTPLNGKFLYIAYGHGDRTEEKFKPASIKMRALLERKKPKGLVWMVDALDNNSHATTPLEGIFKGWMALNTHFASDNLMDGFYRDSSISLTNHLKKFYAAQSAQFNIALPGIDDINHIAYNCFYSRRNADAIEILTWALELYPEDANLYDSMGEIQQESGNKDKARAYYTKGLAIVEKQKSLVSAEDYARNRKGFEERIKSVQ